MRRMPGMLCTPRRWCFANLFVDEHDVHNLGAVSQTKPVPADYSHPTDKPIVGQAGKASAEPIQDSFSDFC